MKKVIAGVLVASCVLSGVPMPQHVLAETINEELSQQENQQTMETGETLQKEVQPNVVSNSAISLLEESASSNEERLTINSVGQVDTYISEGKQDNVTAIMLQGQSLKDDILDKLYQFTKVEVLDLSQNYLTTIDFSKWPNLKAVWLNNNQLISLNVSSNTKLEVLEAYGNYTLTGDIDLSAHSALKSLVLNDTNISKLTLPTNSALESVWFNHNPSLREVVYPMTGSGKLEINPKVLYEQDFEGLPDGESSSSKDKGTYIEWTKVKDSTSSAVNEGDKAFPAYGYTLKAKWQYKSYTIQYKLPTKGIQWKNGESGVVQGAYGKEVTLPSESDFTIDSDYEWKGWSSTAGTVNGNTLTVKPKQNGTTVMVTPKVSRKAMSVTFEKADTAKEAQQVEGIMEDSMITAGKSLSLPACSYKREGYTFIGWEIKGETELYYPNDSYDVSEDYRGNLIVTAQWKVNEGTITIGDSDYGNQKSIDVTDGVHTLTKEDLEVTQTKEGYQFAGWLYNGRKVVEGEKIVLERNGQSVTLTPDWRANKYFVKYEQEDGSDIATQILTYDEATVSIVEEEKVNQKDNYTFVGWQRKSDNTRAYNQDTVYYLGQPLMNLTATDGETVTLQPVYREKARQMVITRERGDSPVYTGNPIQLDDIKVKVEDKELVLGEDYTLEYKNNTNVGIASVTAKPINGKLYDEATITFQIQKASMPNDITVEGYTGEYDGKEHSVTVNGTLSTSTVYYRVQGENQWTTENPKFTFGDVWVEVQVRDPNYHTLNSTVQVKIAEPKSSEQTEQGDSSNTNQPSKPDTPNNSGGSGNTSGGGGAVAPSVPSVPSVPTVPTTPDNSKPENTEDAKEEQKPSDSTDTKKDFVVPKIEKQEFTGKKVTPKFVIKDGDKKLEEGKDYNITYKNNNKIGKATAIVTGIGQYKGLKETYSFVILPKTPAVQTKAGDSSIKITTKGQKGTSTLIQYSSDNGKTWKTIKTSAKTKTIKGLKKGTYKIRVRSYKKVKGVTYKSAYTTKTTVKVQ